MTLFKINGERNSGTRFLGAILQKNGFNIIEHQIKDSVVKFWKHGVPDKNVKLLNDNVIDIFIFRDLKEWLVSMFKNPYHLKPIKNFNEFLVNKQTCIDFAGQIDYHNKKFVNYEDEEKTIFEIRYHKIKKIYEYRENNNNVVFVNLTFLQKDENVKIFIQALSEKYLNIHKNDIITSISHTKNNSNLKNRTYEINIDEYKNIVDISKDEHIEKIINNLTFEIKD